MKMDQVINNQVPETMPIKTATLPDNLSPQCIGREFVRCYYTLLHDNPNKLHRFYLDQSTFVHGNQTDETAECVTGQRAIHEKIMSLKFEDCRTKIKHVDSQATIDDGVVVQVSGELSNAGQLPRRFMQTFVLGSQTPRKYYVHNDIFRYQDEVFGYDHDDGCEDHLSLSSQEDLNDNMELNNEEVITSQEAPIVEDKMPEEVNSFEEQTNGDIVEEPLLNNHDPVDVHVPDYEHHTVEQPTETIHDHVPEIEQFSKEPLYEPEPQTEEEIVPEPEPEVEEEIVEPEPEKPKGPKSWAMIAGAGSGAAPPRAAPAPARIAAPKPKPAPEPVKEVSHKKETTFQPFVKDTEALPAPRAEISGRGGRRGAKESNRERGGFSSGFQRDRFQERDAPNAHQIFVGNLPNNTKHEDLESVFKKYGNVVHTRVTPNNFGFVVFENDGPVQEILAEVRDGEKIFLQDNRLNIEEKKTVMNNNRGPRKAFNEERRGGGSRRGRRGGPTGRSYNDHNSDLK